MLRKVFRLLKHNFIYTMAAFLLAFLFISANVSAARSGEGSLQLKCEMGISEFSLYQIAELSERGEYQLTEVFAPYAKTIKGLKELEKLDTTGWRGLATALENCVLENQLKPQSIGQVDKDGMIIWSNLSDGLYLILGQQTKDSEYIYTASPVLIAVPNWNTKGELVRQVEIHHQKIEKEPLAQNKDLEVVKIWKDTQDKSKRPSEVRIQLYKDGKVYDEVILNVKNNWKHEWKNLSNEYKWTIVEKNIPKDYQVEYSKEGNTIYVINHYESEKPEKPPAEKLPQSGQLWWPVPILAILGIGFLMIGWMKREA